MLLLNFMGGKRRFEEDAGKMDEKEEEEHSPLILVLPKQAGKKATSNPDEQSTQDDTERTNIEGTNESIIQCNKWGDTH